ncbi:hypothetical protein BDE40_1696 [Litoreibacter halocynthiae]|uniref:Uncharacterized protein n=1 Tax=Litoreibacter halocynthiae TaxID=1242689 RepID=A0A4R7LGV6_9RHOB|nr:hypothetical protein BDE40_1696 [Litoreibacter halocynthiae]
MARIWLARFAKPWIAGWLSLSAAWLLHEIVTFGFQYGFLTRKREVLFFQYPSGLAEIVVVALVMSWVAAVPLALACLVLRQSRPRLPVLGVIWLILCMWGYSATASGYREHFGATWLWHEPFVELMWSPWLTPLATLLGLLPFLRIIRKP